MVDGRVIGGVDLLGIMAAARKLANLLVGKMLDQGARLRVLAEEMFANIGAALDKIFLKLAVNHFIHALHELAAFVAL